MISYEDFDLRIHADGTGFAVTAGRGSQAASEPFELDLSRPWDLWELEARGPKEAEELGAVLFDALIRGRIRDLYHQARGGARGDAASGLRIRVLLDPGDERLRPLLRLPWEILLDRSADAAKRPALDPRRPVVRTAEGVEETLSSSPETLQRVLLAPSNAASRVPLKLVEECARVEQALAGIPIRPTILKKVTRSRLHDCFRDGDFQIVHFMGHGTFKSKLGEGVLLLEDEYGEPDPFPAGDFAALFTGKPMPRLVILASCLSAEPGRDPAFGPFAGVAAALAAAGLPAVLAMQAEIRDRSAIRFTERLYRRLAKGDPIEAAVSDARNALRVDFPRTLDWAVPVLFVRGRVKEKLSREQASVPAPLATPGRVSVVMNIDRVTESQIIGSAETVRMDRLPGAKR